MGNHDLVTSNPACAQFYKEVAKKNLISVIKAIFKHFRRSTREQLESLERFMALHRLLPIIGCDESDALGDALLIIIVENLHKQLLSEHIPPMVFIFLYGQYIRSTVLTGRAGLIWKYRPVRLPKFTHN